MKIVAILLFLVTFIAVGSNVAAQDANPCDTPNNLPPSFFEVEKGPQGDWSVSLLPDPKQSEDANVPVAVVGAGAIQGPANRRGLRLGCGVLKNRSKKQVTAIRLRWILARGQDRAAIARQGYTPDTVLLDGHTPAIELSIQKEGFRRTDFSIINFAAATERLSKEGMLSGDYLFIVGVYEVVFADGSAWNAGTAVSK